MIAVIQRVKSCSVWIDKEKKDSINTGILILLGIEKNDDTNDMKYLTNKIINMRIFNDNNDKMNLSIKDIQGEMMVVSQFTLCAEIKKGNRPSYINAMNSKDARLLYNKFTKHIKQNYSKVKSGIFQSHMKINLINNGPVTIIARSRNESN